MILRPLEPVSSSGGDFFPAWDVVMRTQKQRSESCWMITQPSHAALAGDIASRLSGPQVPQLEPELVRAIALHDAGWGMPDAQAVMRSRAAGGRPQSFIEASVAEFTAAWTQSIQVAQSTSPAGGYAVSRHFWRIGKHRLDTADDVANDRSLLQRFLNTEEQRQKKLEGRQQRSVEELENLTDVLQLCDLLSLYICCGAQDNVEFPEYLGVKARLIVESDGFRFSPAVIESGAQFAVAALRHPATKEMSGEQLEIRFL
ncbi:MAG TPA: DUF3891 family protein [Terriglobales bacterium]|nr:DUF3891 family protein [Terriglobales bacterium]